jgi:glycosyltransferase involved in cell wall biosynthesis
MPMTTVSLFTPSDYAKRWVLRSSTRHDPPILCDLTSLVTFCYRSGIQRVTREALRYWPDPDALIPCAFGAEGRLRLLSRAVLPILCSSDRQPPEKIEEERRALRALEVQSTDLPDGAPRHLLNLELFYEESRADAYIRLVDVGWQAHFLVYDFFPWLHPEFYSNGTTRHCMHYLRALRRVDAAFISEQTRQEYTTRIMRGRRRPGPVLPLGADGLGLERQSWSPDRRMFVAIGTLEARKNPDRLMEAARLLWRRGLDVRLTIAGRIEDKYRPALADLAAMSSGRLTVLDQPSDELLRGALREARAVVYASEVEGFGLPPYESLFSGIPSIAAASLPSLQLLPSCGHIALPRIGAETLADAMAAMLDDAYAERLWQEAAGVDLPTWRDFGHAVAAWAAA